MKVKECMCSKVVCVKPESTIESIAKEMQQNHIGCVPVCDNKNQLVGLITDRDITLRCVACNKDAKQTKASDIMTTDVYSVGPNTSVEDATEYMCECQVRRFPVVENGNVVGILTLGDLAQDPNISSNEVAKTIEGVCQCGKHSKNAE